MGTSKRRLNDEVKKMLLDYSLTDLDKIAPKITDEVLKKKVLEENFDEIVLRKGFDIVSGAFINMQAEGYNGIKHNELKENEISRESFLQSIIKEIEAEEKIESRILKKAYKLVMSQIISLEYDVSIFARLLFKKVIFLLLEQELNDTLREVYESLTREQIKILLTNSTDKIFTETVHEDINLFIEGKIPLEKVLKAIRENTSHVEFGEF